MTDAKAHNRNHPAYWPTYQAVLMAAAVDLYRTRGKHSDGYQDAISDCIGDAMAAADEAVAGFLAEDEFMEYLDDAVNRRLKPKDVTP